MNNRIDRFYIQAGIGQIEKRIAAVGERGSKIPAQQEKEM
jgi:hypothetical protein